MMNHIIHLFITALVNACNLQLINNFQGCIGIKLLLMLGKSSAWNVGIEKLFSTTFIIVQVLPYCEIS